jgi:GntR family transcriptional regulator/MocR family aminotransferase
MPDDLTVSAAVTGLHLVALFTDAMRTRMSDREAAAVLKQAGIHVQPLSQNFLAQPTLQGLVFGYGRLRVEDASPLLARIAACIGSGRRNAPSDPAISSLTVRTIKRG